MKKLFLIDGHALIFKMYYAFASSPIVNSKSEDMSILYGFTKYLLELIDKENPSHIAVCFDPPGGSFRNELFPDYKANRAETPKLIIDALEPLCEIVGAMNIPVLMMKGFEADDVIGSAAIRFANEGFDVYMVTPDKDFGQLVSEHILQFKPGKGRSENEILGPTQVCEKWGIRSTKQVVDILAICGDTADNVPGVSGVGPKGAAKLLEKYENLEEIYEHISELTPRQQDLFNAAKDHIALSKQLVIIKKDIELNIQECDLEFNMRYTSTLDKLMNRYEFPSLKRLISKITGTASPIADQNSTQNKASNESFTLPLFEEVAPKVLGTRELALYLDNAHFYAGSGNKFSSGELFEFKEILENETVTKYGYNLKEILNYAATKGIEIKGKLIDIELLHYLLNPESNHKLESLLYSYLGINLENNPESGFSLFDEIPENKDTIAKIVLCIIPLAKRIKEEFSEQLNDLYDKIEEPLIRVLSSMENTGVKVDIRSLNEYAGELREEINNQEKIIRELSGDSYFNISSPKQLGEVLFEKMKLDPKAKKPQKGNWPTDENTLKELSDKSPIIDAILLYRGLKKLLSTYIEPFGSYISPLDKRVHTTFNQALTATGRLSSSNPNLQNIPIRSEQGRKIRKAFVAEREDYVIMSADYSQIELRIMAHLCGDQHLIDAFKAGEDIHAATAAKIFGIDISKVSPDQRRIAKTANFGIMYGISAFGLSQRLSCSRSEAKQFIADYFDSFPQIRAFIDQSKELSRQNGYVETLFNRRRYLPDINSKNMNLRSIAERNAVNAPIQGSAADIIKLAMIAVQKRLIREQVRARIVLQIHDELLLELPESEVDIVKTILKEEMENVTKLSVPLTIECNYGKNWLEAH